MKSKSKKFVELLIAEIKAIVGILVAKKANIVRMTSILRIALDFRANAL